MIRAFAPASMGNVAAGFDVLGAALRPVDGELWGDVVEATPAAAPTLRCVGPFAARLPPNPAENLVERTRTLFAEALERPLPPLALTLHKGLPVSSGVGSSSASVVAAAVALNAACGQPLSQHALLEVVARAESVASGAVHLDNVAPCLQGGLRLITPADRTVPLPWPADLLLVVASPELALSTRMSRSVLPRQVPLTLAVAHAQNLACLIHALHANDRPLLRMTLRDLVAEPHRADLVPGFRALQHAALDAGAWGCSLSGAGPAVFAVAEAVHAPAVADAMLQAFARVSVPATVRTCGVDQQGARQL